MSMTLEEAIKLLKQYQGYEPMFPDGETLKHAFDLTDETVDTLLTALRPVSREQVEKGRWIFRPYEKMPWCTQAICSECGSVVENNSSLSQESGIKLLVESNPFCRRCGAPMTDEAVDIMVKRLEATRSGKERLP